MLLSGRGGSAYTVVNVATVEFRFGAVVLLGFNHVTNSLATVTIRHLVSLKRKQTVSKEEFMWEGRDGLMRCCRLLEKKWKA